MQGKSFIILTFQKIVHKFYSIKLTQMFIRSAEMMTAYYSFCALHGLNENCTNYIENMILFHHNLFIDILIFSPTNIHLKYIIIQNSLLITQFRKGTSNFILVFFEFLCTQTSNYTRKHRKLIRFHKTFTTKDTFVSIIPNIFIKDSIRLISKPKANLLFIHTLNILHQKYFSSSNHLYSVVENNISHNINFCKR